ncbi:hypothetical protein AB0C77_35680 [Streptomyces sp. NPDC048629]|uniref:hypothetical protein n=1 Tax=Streptomyces sp. NPDC048629 TaxID=3154824 RepID=UPI003441C470
MRIALRTALASAAVAGVALTPVLTAGAAHAADAPAAASAAEPKSSEIPLVNALVAYITETEPKVFTARIVKDGETLGTLRAGSAPGAPAVDRKVFAGVEVTLKADGEIGAVVVDEEKPQGELVKRYEYAHGYEAVVYKQGDGAFSALIRKDGSVIDTLTVDKAKGKTYDSGNYEGMSVELFSDGNLVSTGVPGGLDDDSNQENPLGKFAKQDLGHGYKGLVTLKEGGKLTARILKGDKEVGRLHVNQTGKTRDEKVFGGEIRVTLHWNGELRAVWLGGDAQKPGKTTQTGTAQTTVVPKGGVAAGAELADGGDSTVLIASAAGATAAAAVLGFVVVRRRAGAGA